MRVLRSTHATYDKAPIALSVMERWATFGMYFILRGFLSWPELPCLKGPQVTLKRPESLKHHNNKFTFNFWPYS